MPYSRGYNRHSPPKDALLSFWLAFAETTGTGTGEQEQPFKYNGKELDREMQLNTYDHAARYMNSAIGRFTSIDPHAEKYYSWSPYAYVANNPLKYIDPTGKDIVITGTDGTSITLKTDAFDFQLASEINFGGQHEIADLTNIAIGYERALSGEAAMFGGVTVEGSVQSVLFLGGENAGYWYDYVTIGGGVTAQTGVSASGSVGSNVFLGINHNEMFNNAKGFEGGYVKTEVSGGLELGVAGAAVSGNLSTSLDGSWTTIGLGASTSLGPQLGIFDGGYLGGSFTGGKTSLINPQNVQPTNTRSRWSS